VVHTFKVKICYFEHLADGAAPAAVQDLAGLGFESAEWVDGDLFVACARPDRREGRFWVKRPAVSMVTRGPVVPPPCQKVARERKVMSFIKRNLLTENSEVGYYKRPRPVVIGHSLISSMLRNEANAMGCILACGRGC